MTCEIAIMNRQAVALAADSAATVMHWVDGKPEPRYFKGANKIFQLSDHHPVGMMIYGSATLQEVPWELVVKDFRKSLGDKSFNSLEGYADELFGFIRDHAHLFPADYQVTLLKDEAEKQAWAYLAGASQDDSVTKATDNVAKMAAYANFFSLGAFEVEKQQVMAPFNDHDLETALAYKAEVATQVDATIKQFDPAAHPHIDFTQLAELAIKALLRKPTGLMASTGVVIAGYGDHDYFPGYVEHRCFGLLLGKFISERSNAQQISIKRPAHIDAFATTSMIETFQTGFSPDVYSTVVKEFESILKDFGEKIRTEVGAADIPNIETHIKAARSSHAKSWRTAAQQAHYWPLIRVIGALPIDEMADLAETLIVLQSLKEKVTQPSESVGGPVDVAVVSKGDGFIWRKRKHYFEPQLNPRFFQRQKVQ
jgi:hypothetical protein